MKDFKREMIYKDGKEQSYAVVKSLCGDCRLIAVCENDSSERLCHIRGKLKHKQYIKPGDVILIAFREFQHTKCDVLYKYSDEEAKILRKQGEIRTMEAEQVVEEEDFEFDLEQEEVNLEEI